MRRLGLTLVAAVALLGCPASFREICEDQACVAPDGGAIPPGCDLGKELAASPACVDELVGFFVSPAGSDDGDGSRRKPWKTLTKALSQDGKRRIYLCEGTYAGAFAVAKPVAIWGGVKCDWTPAAVRPVIAGESADFAVRITAGGVSLVDLVVQGKDAVAPSQSSVGLVVAGAQGVSLTRVKVTAGAGKSGTDAVSAFYTYPAPASLDGKSASGTAGGPANGVTCPGGAITTGGKGGDNGLDGQPGLPSGTGGVPGTFLGCASAVGGGAGDSGASATAAASPVALGALGAGWSPAPGARGGDGAPGQGGGGGGGRAGGGGGGGGAGGCGGAGGGGGGGGGASLAIVSIDSTLSLTDSEIVSGAAGSGGLGVAGQPGQGVASAGGSPAAGGCSGGAGGKGGDGGAGAGGSGGVSAGVLYRGTAPSQVGTTKISFGTKGNKGVGGAPGQNDGKDGVAQAVFEVK